jgi:hypothetical protein
MPDDETVVDQTAVHERTETFEVRTPSGGSRAHSMRIPTREDWGVQPPALDGGVGVWEGVDPARQGPEVVDVTSAGRPVFWPRLNLLEGPHGRRPSSAARQAEAEAREATWRARREVLTFGLIGALGVELVALLVLLVLRAADGVLWLAR